jgi:tetratricopeptide (TPR) repeat protein
VQMVASLVRSGRFASTSGLLFMFLLIPSLASAQAEHSNHTVVGWVPEEILNRPVALRRGIGEYHEKVTTSSALAQKFYDQGAAYLHSYVWIEAARSFHQALRSDPKMAMAYLGLSYEYSPMDYAAAHAALEKAKALSAGSSDREQRRILIRGLQLEAMADVGNPAKLLVFRQALDEALTAYPQDVELLLLRGHADEPTAFGDGQGCVPSATPYYQRAQSHQTILPLTISSRIAMRIRGNSPMRSNTPKFMRSWLPKYLTPNTCMRTNFAASGGRMRPFLFL